jgi:protein ImuB
VFRDKRELEDTIDLMEPLLLLISQMLGEICERLRYHGRATTQIRLRLKLERAEDYTMVLNLPVPTLNTRVMLKLLQLEMNEQPPVAPVEKVFVELEPANPRATQNGLFLPAAPEPEKLEITLARIRVLVGAENVGAPEVLDTHRPDAVRMTTLAQAKNAYPLLRPAFALRRFRPPQPAQVWCADRGRPLRISSPVGSGKVVSCAGPWSSSGDWWTNSAWSKQEWDVEVQSMGVSRISQDVAKKRWVIEGNYD